MHAPRLPGLLASLPRRRTTGSPTLRYPLAMVPPRFEGPTHPRPKCGRVTGGFVGFRVEHLEHVGWAPSRVETYVNWCGHG
jgi:hypothetical protein